MRGVGSGLSTAAVRHPFAALATANMLYAGSFPASQVALRDFSPVTLTGLRFLIAGAVLAPIAIPVIRRLARSDLRGLFLVAALGLWVQMVLIYLGIDRANSAIAAIIVGLEPVLIALWAALLLNERFGKRTTIGLGIGLAGSLLVSGLGRSDGASIVGLLFLLGTGLTFSWYTVASKGYLNRCGPLELTAAVSLLGAVFGLVPMAVDTGLAHGIDDPDMRAWLLVAFLGIGNSVVAYMFWNRALEGLPAGAVGTSLYAQPVLGAGLSWFLLRDPMPATFLPGAALVLLGVWIATGRRRVRVAASGP
jgi:drug/metabolite transporter (DMT)-like permease